jgi:signal transduction histidine kinase
VITHGEVPSSIGSDFPTLLPKEIFLEVLERKIVVFNTPQELCDRLGAPRGRAFAHQNLFVGCIRRHRHLAFLLLADRIGTEGFRPRDTQTFTAVMEAAAVAIENARLFDDVQAAEKRHRDLLHGIINAQEQESKLVAAEWQDRISKKLLTVLQGLRGFQSLIQQRAPESGERFQKLTAEIDEIASLVRGLTNEIHPSVLDDFGVAAAIREYVADALASPEERELLQVTVQADEIDQQLPNEAKLLLFRITQEALRNIRKHAGAKNVQIAFVQEHAGVSLMIKDDGKGFNPGQPRPGHFGLQYMRERAEACGGTFRVVSSQGEGTEVHINLPSTGM